MKIAKDCIVELSYRIYDEHGKLVESTEEADPIAYLHGHEEIQPSLERALTGQEAGAELKVRTEAGEAFGEYDPEQMFVVPRTELPPDAEIVPGDWIEISLDGGEDEAGGEERDPESAEGVPMRVVELRPDAVYLDANHPLAGQAVTFEVKVLGVRTASAGEIAAREHGGCGHDHGSGESCSDERG